MTWLFVASVALLLYTYAIYPCVLFVLDGVRQARGTLRHFLRGGDRRRREEAPEWPAVSLVVAAHDEEACIGAKLDNSLALDYPPDGLEVIVGSDGSTDRTDALVRACRDGRVVLSPGPRGGKVAVLNRCIPAARGEIVILTDANTILDRAAVRRLVARFRDPTVGAVCGRLRLYNRARQDYEESAYWTYESVLKLYEGSHGCVLGANGGLYAIRRALFTALPPDTIVDDFVIPLRIRRAGHEVVYEPEAVAFEETCEDYGREFGRRARIAAGNFQSLRMVGSLLLPSAGFTAFAFWSHKLLRWAAPLLMALAAVSNLFLLQRPWAWLTLGCQAGFYALALAGKRGLPRRGALRRAGSLAYYFVTMNLAMLVGLWRFLRGSQSAAWQRTAR